MPIQTLTCPQCARTVTADIPPGSRAQLIHRESGVDVVKVTPRVSGVQPPTEPTRPGVARSPQTPRLPDFLRRLTDTGDAN